MSATTINMNGGSLPRHCTSIATALLRRSIVVLLLFSSVPAALATNTTATTPKAGNLFESVSLSTVDIIKQNGYAAEVHNVVTEDGYILELHRIPRNKSGQGPTRNHPVFFHHAFLSNSAIWVIGGHENTSLCMQLVDEGYDVWLGNSRGNTYSRKHESMTYKQKGFWKFSLHEIGKYDLPASIDYILTKTNASQLHYIGYSMGTTVFFIMASERPEYQPKIRSQISLGPVVYLSKVRSPIKFIAFYAKLINKIFQKTTNGMLLPHTKLKALFASKVCGMKIAQKLICQRGMIFFVCGSDPQHFNTKIIPLIAAHFPAGTSSMVAEHFAQFKLKDSFGQYDYGAAENLQQYNDTEAPAYNLTSVRVPVTLIYGKNDLIADEEDVIRLRDQLPMLMDAFPVDNPYCNHVDFLWSLKVNEHVNDPVKGILRKTDAAGWRYSGPSPSAVAGSRHGTGGGGCAPAVNGTVRSSTADDPNFVAGLDYFAENLDAIIASAMPRTVARGDRADFERERELQKFVFGKLIDFVNAAEHNRRGGNGSADEFPGRTNVQKMTEKQAGSGGVHGNDRT